MKAQFKEWKDIKDNINKITADTEELNAKTRMIGNRGQKLQKTERNTTHVSRYGREEEMRKKGQN